MQGEVFDGENDSHNIMTSFEGEYYGRDECNCRECRVFWARWSNTNESGVDVPPATLLGEPVRWCPTPEEGGRKIGEYIGFQLKADEQSSGGETCRSVVGNEGGDNMYHRMV